MGNIGLFFAWLVGWLVFLFMSLCGFVFFLRCGVGGKRNQFNFEHIKSKFPIKCSDELLSMHSHI